MASQMLELLRQYYANTDQEIIKQQWQKIEQIEFDAPNAVEYTQFLYNSYSLERDECNQK